MTIEQTSRILVVANETVDGAVVHAATRGRRAVEVLVIAPALNSRLRHWLSDEDEARRDAERRLGACLERLRAADVDAIGRVGDADPLLAIDDSLRLFPADEIVIATRPDTRPHGRRRNLVGRARSRYRQPILHVVVDPAGGQEYVAA